MVKKLIPTLTPDLKPVETRLKQIVKVSSNFDDDHKTCKNVLDNTANIVESSVFTRPKPKEPSCVAYDITDITKFPF
jgi:hypothetical protein